MTILAHRGTIRPPKSATILGDTSTFHISAALFQPRLRRPVCRTAWFGEAASIRDQPTGRRGRACPHTSAKRVVVDFISLTEDIPISLVVLYSACRPSVLCRITPDEEGQVPTHPPPSVLEPMPPPGRLSTTSAILGVWARPGGAGCIRSCNPCGRLLAWQTTSPHSLARVEPPPPSSAARSTHRNASRRTVRST